MAKQIIIGKEGNQPFALQDPKVSRRHAYLNIDDNGVMTLVDNQSTNGTYIYNGQSFVRLYPNQQYKVTPETFIQLGPETRFHVRRLIPGVVQREPVRPGGTGNGQRSGGSQKPGPVEGSKTQKPAPKPPKVDISILRRVSDVYEKNKMEIDGKVGMINSMRSFTIIISLIAGAAGTILTQQYGSDNVVPIYAGIGIGAITLMVILLAVINSYSKNLNKRKVQNEKDYSIRYVCPACKTSFRGKIYENILAEGRCPKPSCKAEYYEKVAGK